MGFDEEDKNEKDTIELFGLKLSSGVTYTVLAILTLIFIRQAYIVLQALI